MPTPDLIVSVDQGSSSTKALLVSPDGAVLRHSAVGVSCTYPHPGWVEQSAAALAASVHTAVADLMVGIEPGRVAGLALSTQRESLVLWDESGHAVAPVITWQDQRTAAQCADLVANGLAGPVRAVTGLPLDPMFSGTKATWLLNQIDPTRARARRGELRLGTVDSWLLQVLTGEHLTEPGNASRTQLLDLRARTWSENMLAVFEVPPQVLPRLVSSGGPFGALRGVPGLLDGTPVLAVLADSHAALFAHGAWTPGEVKATYGTGSSVMGVAAFEDKIPDGLCHTVAWQVDDEDEPVYAVEGNIRSSGSTLSWLAGIVSRTPAELAELAAGTTTCAGVTIVPAFNGLGAPWWDSDAQGVISGLSLGSGLAHLARAAIESVAFQIEDVVEAMSHAVGPIPTVLADGGASSNDQLMQLQADLGGRHVRRSQIPDLSPLGAAHFAGLRCGLWDEPRLRMLARPRDDFSPLVDAQQRGIEKRRWDDAVARSRQVAKAAEL
jgi:glycerol kinase